jgi:hypothetical protein
VGTYSLLGNKITVDVQGSEVGELNFNIVKLTKDNLEMSCELQRILD